jgi:hypothetical protein
MFRWRAFLLFAFFHSSLSADKVLFQNTPSDLPWLTGTLITPTSLTVPAGHFDIEAYLYATFETGNYNSHWHAKSQKTFLEITAQYWFEFGLTSWMDMEIVPTFAYNHCNHAGEWVWNDLIVMTDFQLYRGSFAPNAILRPAVKLTFGEIFPVGKYQHLAADRLFTDEGGQGSFQTFIGLTIGQLFQFSEYHYLNLRAYAQYTIPSSVHMRGRNTYGGASETRGIVYPGQSLLTEIGTEYTLTKNWVLACDFIANWVKHTKFVGETGGTAMGQSSSAQFSLAPAIEYNWNSRVGIISGCWFTIAGRNSTQFYSSSTALNYYY